MTTRYRIALLLAAGTAGLALPIAPLFPGAGLVVPAHAQANCEWYAKTALKQQQENELLQCGFQGAAWNTDFKAHAAWCQSVAPDIWKEQAKKRDQELLACTRKK